MKPPSPASREFLRALSSAPPVVELPWMRVELTGESGNTRVFCLAVHDGWIVSAAPIARRHIGQRARAAWKLFANRGAVLSRLDPPARSAKE
jgi:hypothetical protein